MTEPTPATWLSHASDCPQGADCTCDHPGLVVAKAMEWGCE